MERLWAPWRLRYVEGEVRHRGCIFCEKPAAGDDVRELILLRGARAYLIMNLFPYNTGHAMAVPFQHVADLAELDRETTAELFELVTWLTVAQRRALRCDGFNVGLNLGAVAGAGISDHLHVHIVPRWQGDANFMPILANTMVIPELIPVTYAKLRAELEVSSFGRAEGVVPQAGAIVWLPDEGKLALRRAADGTIVLPKGHIEPGEAAYRAALREVAEEQGLVGEVIGWGGVLEFAAGGRPRRVAYLLVQARPGADFERHVGHDTLLFEPSEAVEALTHEDTRRLVIKTLQRFGIPVVMRS
ncbi:NUDIX domain-containing protein [Thermomicrobium sp. CFH 73360]|uniref:NUDIX domain-containing protein n=1 Tax=Thermomicrobium sp. CFH 73360 TaxID=2951987 RepID=UPI00207786C5|nr:NUDIX domain-containing protein [Thermomicrobium sp. CFH 73360]MCM8747064.1 NUDIX domain-containing protein [Thermomicrobium sp. CFH 73360]MCM8747355.1 NUDIX domain-containing protein [Thermomicrobium sp. CFH 73360]